MYETSRQSRFDARYWMLGGKVLMALTSEQTRPHVHVLTPQGEVLLKIQVVLSVVACTALVNRVVSPEDLDPRVLRV